MNEDKKQKALRYIDNTIDLVWMKRGTYEHNDTHRLMDIQLTKLRKIRKMVNDIK